MPYASPRPQVHASPKQPDHKTEQWAGDPKVPAGHGTYENPQPTEQPPVPKGAEGSGTTSVDTPSMNAFAGNVERLISPVQKAQAALRNVDVAPGAFYHAYQLRSKVTGDGTGGLKDAYSRILDDLADGLTELSTGMRNLSKQYDTTEEANGMTAKDLQDQMQNAVTDFGALERDSSRLG